MPEDVVIFWLAFLSGEAQAQKDEMEKPHGR
jgi:hypothetical protein